MQNYLYNTVVNLPDFPVAGVNFKAYYASVAGS